MKIDTRDPGHIIFIEHGNNVNIQCRSLMWLRGVIGKVFDFES